MNERPPFWAAIAGIGLVTVCCGGPLLVGAIGVLSASALLGWATYLAWPAVALLLAGVMALVFYRRFRRTHTVSEHCEGSASTSSGSLS